MAAENGSLLEEGARGPRPSLLHVLGQLAPLPGILLAAFGRSELRLLKSSLQILLQQAAKALLIVAEAVQDQNEPSQGRKVTAAILRDTTLTAHQKQVLCELCEAFRHEGICLRPEDTPGSPLR
jgi:hypothetical protein